MAQVGAILISYRARYLRGLSQQAQLYHEEFSGGREALTLEYQTVSTVTDPFAEKAVLFDQLTEHQKQHARAELESGQCLSGDCAAAGQRLAEPDITNPASNV